jgi:hypothetical protein
MSDFPDLMEGNKELLDPGSQSLKQMEKGNYPSNNNLGPASITIAWLEERIAELEVMNAMLRTMRPEGDAA